MYKIVIALLAGLSLLVPAHSAQAQARTRCFDETGHCVSGAILDYWQKNGGLAIFGYPISDLHDETPEVRPNAWRGPTQWFERDRLEDHSNEGKGVLAGRLGAEQLHNLVEGLIVPAPEPVGGAAPGCRFFAETGHNMCGAFRSYWEKNGGLARFGYPVSEPFEMTSGNWRGTVQYFERRRMELHDELQFAPIQLGLLGQEILNGQPSAACPIAVHGDLERWLRTVPFRSQMGCPKDAGTLVPSAEQYFERGVMLWVGPQPGEQIGRIYVVSSLLPITYQVYADTWQAAMGDPSDQPPPGLRTPQRGFGKVWREHPAVRERLGWATQPERSETAYISDFSGGALVWLMNTDFVYAFGPNQIAQAKSRSWGSPR